MKANIYASFQSAVIQVELDVKYSLPELKGMQSGFLKNTKGIFCLVSMSKPLIAVTAIVVFVWAAGDDVVLNCSAFQQSFKIVQG